MDTVKETNMSSVEDRLGKCQDALRKQGLKDVKFFFGSLSEKPPSRVASDVAEVLEAVLAGKYTELPAVTSINEIH